MEFVALHTDDAKISGKARAVEVIIGMLTSFIQSYRYVDEFHPTAYTDVPSIIMYGMLTYFGST